MNSAGDTMPRRGCCQRTSASAPVSRPSRHLGLVVEQELLLLRPPRAGPPPGRRAVITTRLHVRIEETQGVAPRFLGLVHGQVGLLQQFIDARSVAAEQGDADAGGAVIVDIAELIGLVERGEDLFADGLGLGRGVLSLVAQACQHHHEFVAAQPGHGIARAHAGGQALGDLLQQQVADVVAQGVVERLEIVQIDEQQRAVAAAARTGGHRLLQAVEQQRRLGRPVSWS